MLIPGFFVRLFTFFERATPDARERIPAALRARIARERVPGRPWVTKPIRLSTTTDRALPPGVVRAVCKSHIAPESFSRIAR